MTNAILFKALQRKNKFRNPRDQLFPPNPNDFDRQELVSASDYVYELHRRGIHFTFPGDVHYPTRFYLMKEPPLFLEYVGEPVWNRSEILSVVGSRKIHTLTQSWMRRELAQVCKSDRVVICSGGAFGVDQLAHLVAIAEARPTIAVMPSGVEKLYPVAFKTMRSEIIRHGGVILSEFEYQTQPHKSHFFHRNRLIAALGVYTLVAQASLRSGTLLTVHHCLQNGRVVATIPAHPELSDFSGNLELMGDGAIMVTNAADVVQLLQSESQNYAELQPTCSG